MANFTLEDAIILATNAHRGQVDKVGEAYILHPLRVMFRFPPYKVKQRMVAVLHDVLEDTPITAEDLLLEGCDPEVVQAVVVMTRIKLPNGQLEPRKVYITRVAGNPLSREVKYEDIGDNTSMERLLRLDAETQTRLLAKYEADLKVLDGRE